MSYDNVIRVISNMKRDINEYKERERADAKLLDEVVTANKKST